jgi:hypothetical protein
MGAAYDIKTNVQVMTKAHTAKNVSCIIHLVTITLNWMIIYWMIKNEERKNRTLLISKVPFMTIYYAVSTEKIFGRLVIC